MSQFGRIYRSVAFNNDFSGSTAPGSLHVLPTGLRFETESGDRSVELPMAGLQARQGGATGDHVYFTHPSFPDWTLTTGDQTILTDPILLADPSIASQLRRVKKSRVLVLAGCAVALLLLGLVVVAFFAFKEVLVTSAAEQIPPSWEAKMGETAFSSIQSSTQLIENPELQRDLERLAEPLLQAIPDKRWQYKLHLAKAEEPNAFALPGGIIVIHSGLILAAERPEEVLGVLAHEIAHVSRRHGTRQILSRAGLWLLITSVVGDLEGISGFLVDSGAFLLTQKYSRNYEEEADETGHEYLVAAGIDPTGLADFFTRLKKLEESGSVPQMPELLSTHPATEERLKRLSEMKRSDLKAPVRPVEMDFKAFQEKLRKI